MTESLADWLMVQLDADEQVARAATPGPWWHTDEADQVLSTRGPDEDVLLDEDLVVADGYALSNGQLRANVAHIALWDPARVLTDIDAKKRLVALHDGYHECVGIRPWRERGTVLVKETGERGSADEDDLTLRLLALPYAGRDGWQERWRP